MTEVTNHATAMKTTAYAATTANGTTVRRNSKSHTYTHVVVMSRTAENIEKNLAQVLRDGGDVQASEAKLTAPRVMGWTSRPDLAHRLAAKEASNWAGIGTIEICEVA